MIQNKLRYRFQLQDRSLGGMMAGPSITGSGGMVLVTNGGLTSKVSLVDKNGAVLTNPVPLTNGAAEFYAATTVASVDLYIMCPDGQFVTMTGAKPDAMLDIPVDRGNPNQVAIIPVLGSDYTSSAENDTGIDLPAKALVLPDVGLQVTVAQAKTMDVGLLSSETGGDADGFMVAIPFTTAGVIAAKSAATATRGALIGAGTLDRGFAVDVNLARSISLTPAAATTTAAGRIFLPYYLFTTGMPTLN